MASVTSVAMCADCKSVLPGTVNIGRSYLCLRCFYKRSQSPDPGMQAVVAERVGADYFACDCGAVVKIVDSVRLMRKSTGRIERVCQECRAMEADPCRKDHAVVTPQRAQWVEAAWTFLPYPENLIRGVCSRCRMELHFVMASVPEGGGWQRMSWAALASAWSLNG